MHLLVKAMGAVVILFFLILPGGDPRGILTRGADPNLSHGGVTPTSGDPYNDTFVFYVWYSDPEGGIPDVYLNVDGTDFMGEYEWVKNKYNVTYSQWNFGSGTHSFFFWCLSDSGMKAIRHPASGSLSFEIDPGFESPRLSNVSVSDTSPEKGDEVEFSILYDDAGGDNVTEASLYLYDLSMISMEVSGTDYMEGVRLHCKARMDVAGSILFQFRAVDSTRLMAYSKAYNLTVTEHYPELYQHNVTPPSGDAEATSFDFSISFRDADGDIPTEVRVYIENGPETIDKYMFPIGYPGKEQIKSGLRFHRGFNLFSGEHRFYFCANYQELIMPFGPINRQTRYPVTGFLTMSVGGNYSPPILFNGSASPVQGVVSTTFTFQVSYKDPDGDAPGSVYVSDGYDTIQMTVAGSDYRTGVLCQAQIKQDSIGIRNITFGGYDAKGVEAVISGLEPVSIRTYGVPNASWLSNGTVSPMVGSPDSVFSFGVQYHDLTSGAPQDFFVVIDDQPLRMGAYHTVESTIFFTKGWSPLWFYDMGLSDRMTGRYRYHFEFEDSQGYPVSLPATGEYFFDVFERIPYLSGTPVSPATGDDLTPFEFEAYYMDMEEPSDVSLILDGKPYPMYVREPMVDGIRICNLTMNIPSGEHNYLYKARLSNGAYNTYPAWGNLALNVEGHLVLSNPETSPMVPTIGSPVNFTISAMDTSGTPPEAVELFVDNEVYVMSRIGDTTRYHLETALNKGNHTYYFIGYVNGRISRLPEAGKYFPIEVRGPNVPILTDLGVDPAVGNSSIVYTFTVVCSDLDGDAPEVVSLVMDGKPIGMECDGSDFATGVRYSHSMKLDAGLHSYYFTASGSGSVVRAPADVSLSIFVEPEEPIHIPIPPKARIEFDVDGSYIDLNGTGTLDDGKIISFLWHIGDRAYSGSRIMVSFDYPGFYKAVLEVTDDDGLIDRTAVMFWVDPSEKSLPGGANVSGYYSIDAFGRMIPLQYESGFKATISSTEKGAVIALDSSEAGPRIVIFDISKNYFLGGLEVEFDMTSSLADLLSNNGSDPVCYLADIGDSYRLFIYLPDPDGTTIDMWKVSSISEGDGNFDFLPIAIVSIVAILSVAAIMIFIGFKKPGRSKDASGEEDIWESDPSNNYRWSEGLDPDLGDFMDEIMDERRIKAGGRGVAPIRERLRRKKNRGGLGPEEYRRINEYLTFIEE